MSFPLKIELHRHFDDPLNLTQFVGAVTWSLDVRGGGGAAVTLRLPIRAWARVGLKTGHLIVIRHTTTQEGVWWGYIDEIRSGRSVGVSGPPHESATLPVELSCSQFTGLLSAARVLLAPGMQVDIPGAIYKFKSWGPAFKAWSAALSTRNPGELMAKAFAALAKQRLPDSMGGEALGDAIPVAWAEADVPPELAGRHIEVPGFALNSFANIFPNGTIWGMIQNTFRAEPLLVEMFHMTCPISARSQQTALETFLDRSSRIVYRMAPLHPSLPVTGPGAVASNLFQESPAVSSLRPSKEVPDDTITVTGRRARTEWTFGITDVMNWSISWSDDDRRNGFHTTTPIQPESQMGTYGVIGTPIVDAGDAVTHGLRFFEASWPFFPTTDDDERSREEGNMVRAIDALSEYSAHCLQDGHLRARGTVSLRPNINLRPGVWATIRVYPGLSLTCYIQEVSQSIQVGAEQGRITHHTQIMYTQGSLDEFTDAYGPTPERYYQTEGGDGDIDLFKSTIRGSVSGVEIGGA